MTQDIDTYILTLLEKHRKYAFTDWIDNRGWNKETLEVNTIASAILEVEGIIEALEYILKYSPLMQLVIEGRINFYKQALLKLSHENSRENI